MKVLHVDLVIRRGAALRPEEETLLGVAPFLAALEKSSQLTRPEDRGARRAHLMSAIEKRRTSDQIMPRMSLRFPSTTSVRHSIMSQAVVPIEASDPV